MLIRTAALALVLAAATSTAGAQPLAREPGAPTNYSPLTREIRVSARGLNLSDERDATTFLQRLTSAITHACDDRDAVATMTLTRTHHMEVRLAGY